MKSFALALTVAVVSANSRYNSYDPSSRYSSRSAPSYGYQNQGYNQAPATQYGYQQPATQHQHTQYPSNYGQQHQHQQTADPYHQHADGSSHQVNPWETQQASTQYGHTVPSGWLDPYRQYSKPTIAYKPEVDAPTFTVCEVVTGGSMTGSMSTYDILGSIEIVQIPGKPSTVKWDLTANPNAIDLVFYPRINETGRLITADENDALAGEACSGISGKEFNPLQETDRYGRANPYQDFRRGRLDAITFDDSTVPVVDSIQNYLLQNLGGKDSIVGRSISIYAVELADVLELAATDYTPVDACCVIALDETPYRWLPTPHYHAQQQQYGNYGAAPSNYGHKY